MGLPQGIRSGPLSPRNIEQFSSRDRTGTPSSSVVLELGVTGMAAVPAATGATLASLAETLAGAIRSSDDEAT